MENKVSRRRFLALAGGTAGAAVLSCGGLVALGTRQLPVEVVQSNCGGEQMEKMLVAYATRCGSTGEVAGAIGKALCKAGAAVDVRPVKDVKDVSAYQAVIVGSAVRMGSWLPEATRFVETHQAALKRVPLAYFGVCLAMSEESEEKRREAQGYLQPVRDLVQPTEEAMFAGAVTYQKLPFLLRYLMKNMIKAPEGDFRDWEAIRAWAGGLPARLLQA